MNISKSKKFTEKHGPGAEPDPVIKEEILKYAKDNELPCALAFQIAKDLSLLPGEVGKTADLMNLRIVKCQLGLFGYKPESKIVAADKDASPELKAAVSEAAIDRRLPCRSAWEIASRFKVRKMTVSSTCEALNIKIKPCQLGAF
ncbi:MAG: hypothetical protein BWK80_09465 [Desulfobacteraceae bacterium IS3]|nr:MAG: hypothetical protein BWK80_09465 [Desulfobacteraceae bacterium IS3]